MVQLRIGGGCEFAFSSSKWQHPGGGWAGQWVKFIDSGVEHLRNMMLNGLIDYSPGKCKFVCIFVKNSAHGFAKNGLYHQTILSTGNMHTKQLNLGAFFPPTLYQTQCADIYRRCNINGQIVALHHRPLSRTCFPIWVVKSRHWPTF